MSEKSQEEHKTQKHQESKEPIEVFICTCRKEYNSFPALYLHNKNKHDVTLRTKEKSKMKRKVVWSGNRKKLVYEFPQESDESEGEQRWTSKKFKRSSANKRRKNQQENQNKITEKKALEQVLLNFLKFTENDKIFADNFKNLQALLHELINFISNTDRNFSIHYSQNFDISVSKVELVPFYLNQFVDQILPRFNYFNLPEWATIRFLGNLSDWMYVNNHSTSLAILNPKSNIKAEYDLCMKMQPMVTMSEYHQMMVQSYEAKMQQNTIKAEPSPNIKIQIN